MESKKVSVITGGASGMGFCTAKELGQESYVVIAGRSEKKLQAASEKLKEIGIEHDIFPCDVSDLDSVLKLAEFAQAKGEIRNVVNSAGIGAEARGADRRKVFETNALGTVNVTKAFYPIIVAGGAQINISSYSRYDLYLFGLQNADYTDVFKQWDSPDFLDKLLGTVPDMQYDKDLAYIISKVFTTWFTEANTLRYAKRGVRIVGISPGCFDTPLLRYNAAVKPEAIQYIHDRIPMGRWGDPTEIARLVKFLCSEDAAYITGTDIMIDGGDSAITVRMKDHQIP